MQLKVERITKMSLNVERIIHITNSNELKLKDE